MRGIVDTLSRLPSARLVIAGAAILAGAFASAAHGQTSGSGNGKGTLSPEGARADEAALVVPLDRRVAGSEVLLPRPLGAADAVLGAQIFAWQARGEFPAAIRATGALGSPLLVGSILADRYLGRFRRASAQALSDWLARYGDLPEAPAIRALLLTRLPKGVAAPAPAEAAPLLPRPAAEAEPAGDWRNGPVRDPVLDRAVVDQAAHSGAAAALRQVTARRALPPAYAALLKAEIAQQLFIKNDDVGALRLARMVLGMTPSAEQPALAFYVGGLAAWRLGRFDVARTLFAGGAATASATPAMRAASALWASRAAQAMHDAAGTAIWLKAAAQEPTTFHGLLARRLLRTGSYDVSDRELLSQADVDAVAATPGGQRAFALLQIGQDKRAEWEFRALWPLAQANPVFGRSLTLVAAAVGMGDLATQMADLLNAPALARDVLPAFPVPRLRPAGGFRVNPPLIYALARVESNFDPRAVSAMGARGLMQIMPETAHIVTGGQRFAAARLHEPAANLAIGQRYLEMLADVNGIGDDLIRLLASYNAGPGNVLRWLTDMRDQDDPLLFIEAIPAAETRAFVPQALAYAWLYAAQMHLPSLGLDALAAGEFPRFTPGGSERTMAEAAPAAN